MEKIITYKHKNCTITLHIPELDDEERERRMEQMRIAAKRLLEEYDKRVGL